MTWIKLDDHFIEHPKIERLSSDAVRAHLRALCYCASQLTDGFLPSNTGQRFAGSSLPELIVELWDEVRNGYQIHDYLDYNPTRVEVLAARKRDSERKAAGRDNQVRTESGQVSTRNPAGILPESHRSPSPSPSPSPIPNPEPPKDNSARNEFARLTARSGKPRGDTLARTAVLNHYLATMPGRRSYELTPERTRVLDAAIEFVGVDGCKRAVEIFAREPAYAFNRGETGNPRRFDGLCEYVLSHRCHVSKVPARIEEVLAQGGLSLEPASADQTDNPTINGLGLDRHRDSQPVNHPDQATSNPG